MCAEAQSLLVKNNLKLLVTTLVIAAVRRVKGRYIVITNIINYFFKALSITTLVLLLFEFG